MRQIIYKLTLVSLTISKYYLTESLHPTSAELALIFYPVCSSSDQPPFALVVIVFPLALVYYIAICIDQLTFSFHLALHPVTEVVTPIVVYVFASTMS